MLWSSWILEVSTSESGVLCSRVVCSPWVLFLSTDGRFSTKRTLTPSPPINYYLYYSFSISFTFTLHNPPVLRRL